MKKKETTVILFGKPGEPEVEAAKKRLQQVGRKVEITTGLCGEPNCQCTEPCKSFHYKPITS
jgi:hypothetical protein